VATLQLRPVQTPLRLDDGGVVRVGTTRVTLDTLVGSYRQGSTAEEIVQQYPTLSLADVHAALAYYLTHRVEVDAYLRERETDAAELRREVGKISDQRGLRERLLARQSTSIMGE
jgi:uncharacterized protein (DUF433 family)